MTYAESLFEDGETCLIYPAGGTCLHHAVDGGVIDKGGGTPPRFVTQVSARLRRARRGGIRDGGGQDRPHSAATGLRKAADVAIPGSPEEVFRGRG